MKVTVLPDVEAVKMSDTKISCNSSLALYVVINILAFSEPVNLFFHVVSIFVIPENFVGRQEHSSKTGALGKISSIVVEDVLKDPEEFCIVTLYSA